MKREYKFFLTDIIDNIKLIDDFVKDKKTIYAVSRSLQIIGEAVSKIPSELQEKHKEIPWKNIKNFRNVVVHKY